MIEINGGGSDGVCKVNLDRCNHDVSVVSSEMSLPLVSSEFNEIRNMSTVKANGLDDVGLEFSRLRGQQL